MELTKTVKTDHFQVTHKEPTVRNRIRYTANVINLGKKYDPEAVFAELIVSIAFTPTGEKTRTLSVSDMLDLPPRYTEEVDTLHNRLLEALFPEKKDVASE